ncbi:MAG: hypothetical protein ACETWB_04200 [Anaerolineae bacterium]
MLYLVQHQAQGGDVSDLSSQIIVVSNTGPLISAFQCRRVDLLQRYFETTHIPESALTEFERHGAEDMVRKLIDEGFISV